MENTIGSIFRNHFRGCKVRVRKISKNQYRVTVHETENKWTNRELYLNLLLCGWSYAPTRIIGVKETGAEFYYKLIFTVTYCRGDYGLVMLQNRIERVDEKIYRLQLYRENLVNHKKYHNESN